MGAVPALRCTISAATPWEDAGGAKAQAGLDRVVVLPGKTYLRGEASADGGTVPQVAWSKRSGPGVVKFADPRGLVTTATFSAPGEYVLDLTATAGGTKATDSVAVQVMPPAPGQPWEGIATGGYRIDSPLWNARIRALIVNWIPHCIDQINRTDLTTGIGGIDNFVEAGKALRGEPHGPHKGYVFSNAWVYQTIESISLALMLETPADAGIDRAKAKMRATLEDWIPKILSAQEPDGYLQTAYTLPRLVREDKIIDNKNFRRWDPAFRGDHEGYVAGYLLEAAICHHRLTQGKDTRLYQAARKLADCWDANLGPPPKKAWYDGHQGMEQALFRFGRYVDEVEGAGHGKRYKALGKFLLDCRYHAATDPKQRTPYDQSHLPVVEQYEAVGHAVRAAYTYTAMADVVLETGDADYRSAAQSLWRNLVHRKYYVTGGIGSGETSEGFGADYSLRNNAYCESCSTCGTIFFQWKMGLAWQEAQYADLAEESLYNALLGCLDLEARHFYYDNPLDAAVPRYAWHVCPCCVGNVPRTLLMLPTWMYARSKDGLAVNHFVGSTVRVPGIAGTGVEVAQATDYPWSGKVQITLRPEIEKPFALRIRIPRRNVSTLYSTTPEVNGLVSLSVNGRPFRYRQERGYAVLSRTWKAGDTVEFELPMQVQRVRGIDKVEATRGKVALRYGPLIYNLEAADQDLKQPLPRSAELRTEWRPDFLGGVMVIRGSFAGGAPLLAVPNFVRMNRVAGLPLPPPPPPPGPDGRRTRRPPQSVVWIQEA